MSNCRSCNAEIEWVETVNGKQMPMDVAESKCAPCDGNGIELRLTPAGADVPACKKCGGSGRVRLSHFATCPTAALHRKPKTPIGHADETGHEVQ